MAIKVIAREFKVAENTISRIVGRKTWVNIPDRCPLLEFVEIYLKVGYLSKNRDDGNWMSRAS